MSQLWSVRVYGSDGKSRGETVIDSTIDRIDGVPITTTKQARQFAKKYLQGLDTYSMIEPLNV